MVYSAYQLLNIDTGFGHDLAKRLDVLGFTVFAGCLHPKGDGAKALGSKASKRVHIVSMDVGNDKSMAEALDYVKTKLPKKGIWGIVPNAGFNVMGDVEWLTIGLVHKAMNVNLYGMIRLTKAFLPFVRKSQGRVVIVSSVKGCYPCPGDSAYHATKFALETVADSLRLEMIKFDVKVSIIEPGDFSAATACQNKVQFKRYREEAEEMWREASDSVRTTYGKRYLEAMIEKQSASLNSYPTTEPVIDALEDALINLTPRTRYLVGGTNKMFDINAMAARLHPYLPTWLSDWLYTKWTGCDKFPE
ncbi:hypothetical protein CHS0354_007780 [Potamilus streckersoni]|uniref:D-beta-hydroxybutyrate dehydrogenase, mitochondrial n=1 Tax=Potamilus streckersoni TaxID=2493646 RepID=A0AAE0RS08_9BIVA|nr:hypothetical protein CHS0354_007780 [Potamilus streckersoni]